MLYFIGTGMTPDSLSVRALRVIDGCSAVYLDGYTSILVSYEEMKALVEQTLNGREVLLATRETVESKTDSIISKAREENVAFLVVGDAMCATTHSDLYLRAVRSGIAVKVLPNASIMNAVSACGVEMYRLGRTISVPFFTDTWRPASFLDKILANMSVKLHSLLLLDIKTRELNIAAYKRGVERYDPPSYMLCNQCCQQICELLEDQQRALEADLKNAPENAPKPAEQQAPKLSPSSLAVCLMRVGTDDEKFVCATLRGISQMSADEMGAPLHSLLVLSDEVSDMEAQMFSLWVRPADEEARVALGKFLI